MGRGRWFFVEVVRVFSYITVLLTFGNVGLKSVFDGFVTLYDRRF